MGKATASALIADHFGELVVDPFEFALNESGFDRLAAAIARAEGERAAEVVRVGVEAAGHYHRNLVARLRAGSYEIVELSPRAVKEARSQQLLARLKSDARGLGAMAELMVRGWGRPPVARTGPLAAQAAWVAHRHRKIMARVALANQVVGQLDLVFPGLGGCFTDVLDARGGRVILSEICDPDRIRRQGVEGLRRFVARRGVQLTRPKAAQVVDATRVALRLPADERQTLGRLLAADLSLLRAVEAEIAAAGAALAEVLPDTPAAVLLTLPGVAVVRASSYLGGHRRSGTFPERRRGVPGLRAGPRPVRVSGAAPRHPAHLKGGLGGAAFGDHRPRPGPVPARP